MLCPSRREILSIGEIRIKFLEEVIEEFEKGVRERDSFKIRDSDALILKYMNKVPSSH